MLAEFRNPVAIITKSHLVTRDIDHLKELARFHAISVSLSVTTLDANGLSCLYKKAKVALSTISSRNWLGRIAARKAIAAAEGLPNGEPSKFVLPLFEDTLVSGKPLQCNPKAATDFYPSNKLSIATIAKYGKP